MVRALPQALATILIPALCAHGLLREVFALHLMLMTRYMVKAYLNLVNAIYCFCKPNSITYILGNLEFELPV